MQNDSNTNDNFSRKLEASLMSSMNLEINQDS